MTGTLFAGLKRGKVARAGAGVVCLLAAWLATTTAHAQDIEPRAYSNAPVGVNFVIAGGVATRGGLSFDSVPITNAEIRTTTAVLAYARVLDLGGRSGKFDVIVPYTRLDGTADYLGQPLQREVSGFGKPAFRLSINLLGAPALALRDFRDGSRT